MELIFMFRAETFNKFINFAFKFVFYTSGFGKRSYFIGTKSDAVNTDQISDVVNVFNDTDQIGFAPVGAIHNLYT